MKVLEQTSTMLKIQISRYSWSVSKYLLFFLLVLAIVGYSYKLSVLKCERLEPKQVACVVTTTGIFETHTLPIPLGQLQGAEIESYTDSDGDTNYKIILITKTEKISSFIQSSSAQDIKLEADKINNFLGNSQQLRLILRQDNRWFFYVVAVISCMIFIFLLLKKRLISFTLDKSSNRLFAEYCNLFSNQVVEYILSNVKRAEVIEKEDSDGDKRYKTVLIIPSSGNISLLNSSSRRKHYEIAETVNNFLS